MNKGGTAFIRPLQTAEGVFYDIENSVGISHIIKSLAGQDAHDASEKAALQPHIGAGSVQAPSSSRGRRIEVGSSTLC